MPFPIKKPACQGTTHMSEFELLFQIVDFSKSFRWNERLSLCQITVSKKHQLPPPPQAPFYFWIIFRTDIFKQQTWPGGLSKPLLWKADLPKIFFFKVKLVLFLFLYYNEKNVNLFFLFVFFPLYLFALKIMGKILPYLSPWEICQDITHLVQLSHHNVSIMDAEF